MHGFILFELITWLYRLSGTMFRRINSSKLAFLKRSNPLPSPTSPTLLYSSPTHKEGGYFERSRVSDRIPLCRANTVRGHPFWKPLLARTEFSISTCKQPCSSQSREIKTIWTQRNLKSVSLCLIDLWLIEQAYFKVYNAHLEELSSAL